MRAKFKQGQEPALAETKYGIDSQFEPTEQNNREQRIIRCSLFWG
jgi:hypothetical protein